MGHWVRAPLPLDFQLFNFAGHQSRIDFDIGLYKLWLSTPKEYTGLSL